MRRSFAIAVRVRTTSAVEFFGVRWLDTALDWSLPKIQSGVEPPHSKEDTTLSVRPWTLKVKFFYN